MTGILDSGSGVHNPNDPKADLLGALKRPEKWIPNSYPVLSTILNPAYVEYLEAENARLRESLRWRKYPEEKPEEEGRYLIAYKYRNNPQERFFIGDYDPRQGEFSTGLDLVVVLRWLPIPPQEGA